MRTLLHALFLALGCAVTGTAAVADPPASDRAWALAADAAWAPAWIAHARALARSPGHVPGFVLQLGDSITHANPYGQWPRALTGASAEDRATAAWLHVGAVSRATHPATCVDGFALAQVDTTHWRGLTALSGETAAGLLLGTPLGSGAAMPEAVDATQALAVLADGHRYPQALRLATILTAFPGAQAAVLLIGTNDVTHRTPAAAFRQTLDQLVAACDARGILVLLTTLPPAPTPELDTRAAALSAEIAACAQAHALPLIPLRAEILRRRPGGTWAGTLLVTQDVHLSAAAGACTASSDPYADGGDAGAGRTGAAAQQVGYLLRAWLTLQKLSQVRQELMAPAPALPR